MQSKRKCQGKQYFQGDEEMAFVKLEKNVVLETEGKELVRN